MSSDRPDQLDNRVITGTLVDCFLCSGTGQTCRVESVGPHGVTPTNPPVVPCMGCEGHGKVVVEADDFTCHSLGRLRSVEWLRAALSLALECVDKRLGELPDFPCRLNAMTARESEIARVASVAVGALTFVQRTLDDARAALAETDPTTPTSAKGEEPPSNGS